MKNTFGTNISVTLAGESHGKAITVILDGIKSGEKIDNKIISDALEMRAPQGNISTSRREKDEFEILSGICDGYTTGTPICISIKNADGDSSSYNTNIIRPGHADYTSYLKYGEYGDRRGGGHFSGRVTVGITAAGAICRHILEERGVKIVSRIKSIKDICDCDIYDIDTVYDILKDKKFPTVSENASDKMKDAILSAKEQRDSLGGITETFVLGLKGGIGEPFFDSIESVISHGVFSVPGVKGIEFGGGFALAGMAGSEANDPFEIKDGAISTVTNQSGGINGGISNGMPIIFRTAFKPTPSIAVEQRTVDIKKKENITYSVNGRHDPCIVPRAVHVINAVTAIAIYDMCCAEYGRNLKGI